MKLSTAADTLSGVCCPESGSVDTSAVKAVSKERTQTSLVAIKASASTIIPGDQSLCPFPLNVEKLHAETRIFWYCSGVILCVRHRDPSLRASRGGSLRLPVT